MVTNDLEDFLLSQNPILKELSFKMMVNEVKKTQLENVYLTNREEFYGLSQEEKESKYYEKLILLDQVGYELSLNFNEILFQEGKTKTILDNGTDVVSIQVENMFNKLGLIYPIPCGYIDKEGVGIQRVYHTSDIIDKDHIKFMNEIHAIMMQGKITLDEAERLGYAAHFFREKNKLLLKYFSTEKKGKEKKS